MLLLYPSLKQTRSLTQANRIQRQSNRRRLPLQNAFYLDQIKQHNRFWIKKTLTIVSFSSPIDNLPLISFCGWFWMSLMIFAPGDGHRTQECRSLSTLKIVYAGHVPFLSTTESERQIEALSSIICSIDVKVFTGIAWMEVGWSCGYVGRIRIDSIESLTGFVFRNIDLGVKFKKKRLK